MHPSQGGKIQNLLSEMLNICMLLPKAVLHLTVLCFIKCAFFIVIVAIYMKINVG